MKNENTLSSLALPFTIIHFKKYNILTKTHYNF